MEIERKFTIKELPADLDSHTCLLIEQAYLNTDPVIRIRRQNDDYYLTYKGKGLMAREDDDILCKTQYIEQILLKYKIISIFCICATCYRCTVKRINKDG